jgi:hypothetical protein
VIDLRHDSGGSTGHEALERIVCMRCQAVLWSRTPTPAGETDREVLIRTLSTAFGPQQTALEPVLTVSTGDAKDMDRRIRLWASGDGIVEMLADAILAAGFVRRSPEGVTDAMREILRIVTGPRTADEVARVEEIARAALAAAMGVER